jgi:hypothetical protein
MLITLGDARIRVTRIEPRSDHTRMYRLTASDSPDLAVKVREGIGCRVGQPASDFWARSQGATSLLLSFYQLALTCRPTALGGQTAQSATAS